VPLAILHEEEQEEDVVLLEHTHHKGTTFLQSGLSLLEMVLSADQDPRGPQVRFKVLGFAVDQVAKLVGEQRYLHQVAEYLESPLDARLPLKNLILFESLANSVL
jgi:hypothetical protein